MDYPFASIFSIILYFVNDCHDEKYFYFNLGEEFHQGLKFRSAFDFDIEWRHRDHSSRRATWRRWRGRCRLGRCARSCILSSASRWRTQTRSRNQRRRTWIWNRGRWLSCLSFRVSWSALPKLFSVILTAVYKCHIRDCLTASRVLYCKKAYVLLS